MYLIPSSPSNPLPLPVAHFPTRLPGAPGFLVVAGVSAGGDDGVRGDSSSDFPGGG